MFLVNVLVLQSGARKIARGATHPAWKEVLSDTDALWWHLAGQRARGGRQDAHGLPDDGRLEALAGACSVGKTVIYQPRKLRDLVHVKVVSDESRGAI